MEKGQLGTEVQRRIIFVWEGAVAHIPDSRTIRAMEVVKRNLNLWDQAVAYWVIHDRAINAAWSLLQTTNLRIDMAITTRPPEFAKAVTRLVEQQNLPIRYVFAQSAPDLGRMLSSMPDVVRVYYGLEQHRFSFGPQGFAFSKNAWRD